MADLRDDTPFELVEPERGPVVAGEDIDISCERPSADALRSGGVGAAVMVGTLLGGSILAIALAVALRPESVPPPRPFAAGLRAQAEARQAQASIAPTEVDHGGQVAAADPLPARRVPPGALRSGPGIPGGLPTTSTPSLDLPRTGPTGQGSAVPAASEQGTTAAPGKSNGTGEDEPTVEKPVPPGRDKAGASTDDEEDPLKGLPRPDGSLPTTSEESDEDLAADEARAGEDAEAAPGEKDEPEEDPDAPSEEPPEASAQPDPDLEATRSPGPPPRREGRRLLPV